MKPINYNGKSIRTYEDIEKLVVYDELNRDMINQATKEIYDGQFQKLISKLKPDKQYYELGYSDKYLYIDNVDKLTYDILEEEKMRK